MALSFFHPLLRHLDAPSMSFLQDESSEVADALLGFVHDPAVNSRIDHFLDLNPSPPLPDDDGNIRCGKIPRGAGLGNDAWLNSCSAGNGGSHRALHWSNGDGDHEQAQPAAATPDFLMPLRPPPMQMAPAPLFMRGAAAVADAKKVAGATTNGCQSAPSAAARERRKRISEKTGELSRLVPGGRRLNTAEMLREAGRHVRVLQAQVGVLALMRTIDIYQRQEDEEIMRALLASGGVQERLAGEGKCLVPRKLVDAMAEDIAVKSNAVLSRDLARFVDSLPVPEPWL